MIRFFAAGVAALLSLASADCFAGGQPLHKGDIIYECPVSGGRASGSRNYIFNEDMPVKYGLSIERVSIEYGVLGPRTYAPFEGKTYYYSKLSGMYKVMLVDKLGTPTFTDELYDGYVPCVNGIPTKHEDP